MGENAAMRSEMQPERSRWDSHAAMRSDMQPERSRWDSHAAMRSEMQPERSRWDSHAAMLVGVGLLVVAVAVGAFSLWPRHHRAAAGSPGRQDSTRIVDAVVTRVTPRPCA